MKKEKEQHTHESFGQIYFGRGTCGGNQKFYGSELPQNHYIYMEIHHSEVNRDLGREWYHTFGSPVVKLRMTSGQFSEMITSLNNSGGVPCTLEVVNGEAIKPLPEQESRKEFVHRKFKDRMKMFADTIREKQQLASILVKKKTLSKQDVHDLTFHIEWLTAEVERNIPFFAECFQENMDDVVLEAKTEIENAIQHKISMLGLKELHKQDNLLSQTSPVKLEERSKMKRTR